MYPDSTLIKCHCILIPGDMIRPYERRVDNHHFFLLLLSQNLLAGDVCVFNPKIILFFAHLHNYVIILGLNNNLCLFYLMFLSYKLHRAVHVLIRPCFISSARLEHFGELVWLPVG